MSVRWTHVITGMAVVLVFTGCESDPSGPNAGEPLRAIGVLEYNGDRQPPAGIDHYYPEGSDVGYIRPPEPLEAPDAVQRGVPFTVNATTVGDGCTRPDGAEVSYTGNTADITAYDIREGEVCILIAAFLTREVTLQFDTVGEATIRLIGRRIENGEEQADHVVIEKQVTVY